MAGLKVKGKDEGKQIKGRNVKAEIAEDPEAFLKSLILKTIERNSRGSLRDLVHNSIEYGAFN